MPGSSVRGDSGTVTATPHRLSRRWARSVRSPRGSLGLEAHATSVAQLGPSDEPKSGSWTRIDRTARRRRISSPARPAAPPSPGAAHRTTASPPLPSLPLAPPLAAHPSTDVPPSAACQRPGFLGAEACGGACQIDRPRRRHLAEGGRRFVDRLRLSHSLPASLPLYRRSLPPTAAPQASATRPAACGQGKVSPLPHFPFPFSEEASASSPAYGKL
jgi:hypothetical protein